MYNKEIEEIATLTGELEAAVGKLLGARVNSPTTQPETLVPHGLGSIESSALLNRVFKSMQERATRSIDAFVCGEHAPHVEGQSHPQPLALERGIRYRVVYDPPIFEREDLIVGMLKSVQEGEEARMSTNLAGRLLIRDSEEFLVYSKAPQNPAQLALHFTSPNLAEFFNNMFESVWGSALPIANRHLGEGSLLNVEEVQILRLLAAGQKDESVARILGISLRTLQRKVQSLQKNFGAASRFQLGAMSAKHLAPSDDR